MRRCCLVPCLVPSSAHGSAGAAAAAATCKPLKITQAGARQVANPRPGRSVGSSLWQDAAKNSAAVAVVSLPSSFPRRCLAPGVGDKVEGPSSCPGARRQLLPMIDQCRFHMRGEGSMGFRRRGSSGRTAPHCHVLMLCALPASSCSSFKQRNEMPTCQHAAETLVQRQAAHMPRGAHHVPELNRRACTATLSSSSATAVPVPGIA